MQTTQHNTRRPVYLHPSACKSPATVTTNQHHTGLLVITTSKGRIKAFKSVAAAAFDAITWPLGGDAA